MTGEFFSSSHEKTPFPGYDSADENGGRPAAGRRIGIGGERDWEAIRAEYVAGGISQRALAEKRGVPRGELQRRAAAEGWTRLRDGPGGRDSDAEIALRVRRRMLMKLERMAEAMPADAVTERKSQDDSAVSLFKLRDLTAAYKELTGDLALEDGEREPVRVIVDP